MYRRSAAAVTTLDGIPKAARRFRLTSLRFCCAANVVTAGAAREPGVYRDCSNRLLGRSSPGPPTLTNMSHTTYIGG